MLASNLSLKELQSALPMEEVEQLGKLLAVLEPGRRDIELITDKQFLGKFYEAYVGADLLGQLSQRRRIFSFLPETRLRELAALHGIGTSLNYTETLDSVCALPWGQNPSTQTTLEFLGLPLEFMPEEADSGTTIETIVPYSPAHKTLYDYQSSIYYRAFEALTPPFARLLIQMPTGAGKTRTAMEVVSAFLNFKPHARILWLAHSEELCEQAVKGFQAVWIHLGKFPVTLVRCWGSYTPTFPSPSTSFTVGGFPKINRMRQKSPSIQADLIIIDEAHMVLAPTYAASVSWAKTQNTRVLGLSATPGRGRSDDFGNEALADYFNRRTIGIDSSGLGVIRYLQGKGVLSRPIRQPLRSNITFHLTPAEWQKLEDEFDYPTSFLRRVGQDHERNKIIIEELWRLAIEKCQVLVFAASVEQSKLLCAALLYKGYKAAHIDGDTSKENRRASIAKFRRGEINFLCNYGVLATGFDSPNTDVVFITRPTKSIVLYSQMIGRGMRGPAVGGTSSFRLVDVIDNVVDYSSDFDDVYEYFAEYWAA
jgi:DNA repair protein RadD